MKFYKKCFLLSTTDLGAYEIRKWSYLCDLEPA